MVLCFTRTGFTQVLGNRRKEYKRIVKVELISPKHPNFQAVQFTSCRHVQKNSLTPQGVQFLYILHQPLQNNENQKKTPPNHPTTQPPNHHPTTPATASPKRAARICRVPCVRRGQRAAGPQPGRPNVPTDAAPHWWHPHRGHASDHYRPGKWEGSCFFREFSNQTADILDGKFSERNLRENPLSYGRFWRSLNMKVARKILLIAVILSFDG